MLLAHEHERQASEALLTGAVGGVVLLFGYPIGERGWTVLGAGYDESVGADEELLADVVGSTLLGVGLAVLALVGLPAIGAVTALVEDVFAAAVLVAVVRTVSRVHDAPSASSSSW